jgi:hypothetical protein
MIRARPRHPRSIDAYFAAQIPAGTRSRFRSVPGLASPLFFPRF